MLLLTAAALQPAPPAPPAAPAAPETRVVREIVVIDGGKGETIRLPEAGSGERRRVMILREGKPGDGKEAVREFRVHRLDGDRRTAMVVECKDGHSFQTEAEGKKDGKDVRTEIRLCTRGKGPTPAAAIDGLERASRRIAENKELPADVREKVLASLNAEIARLKAAK